jgi:hypothetical protein
MLCEFHLNFFFKIQGYLHMENELDSEVMKQALKNFKPHSVKVWTVFEDLNLIELYGMKGRR